MIQVRYENGKHVLYQVSEVWIPHVNGPGVMSVSHAIKIGEVNSWSLETYKDYDLDWKKDFEEVGRQIQVLDENGLRYDYVSYKLKDSTYYKLMYGI